jgi:hypothetical protein
MVLTHLDTNYLDRLVPASESTTESRSSDTIESREAFSSRNSTSVTDRVFCQSSETHTARNLKTEL